MVATEFPDPGAPEFAPIRAELARLYLAHKSDMRLDDFSDEFVVENVNTITKALIELGTHAVARGDRAWIGRFAWWGVACELFGCRRRRLADPGGFQCRALAV